MVLLVVSLDSPKGAPDRASRILIAAESSGPNQRRCRISKPNMAPHSHPLQVQLL
jgi:hypothetical protein